MIQGEYETLTVSTVGKLAFYCLFLYGAYCVLRQRKKDKNNNKH